MSYLDQFPGNSRVALASWSAAARQERRLVVVHESAHVVGALLVGANARVRLRTRRTSGGRAAFSAVVTTRSSDVDRDVNRAFIAAMGICAERKYAALNDLPEPSEGVFQTDFGNMETADLKQETALQCAGLILEQPHVRDAVLRLADELELRWGVADEVNISAAEITAIIDINAVRAMGV